MFMFVIYTIHTLDVYYESKWPTSWNIFILVEVISEKKGKDIETLLKTEKDTERVRNTCRDFEISSNTLARRSWRT